MGYISTERVKEIRTELKNTFPNFKFSITKDDHSGVRINILKGNVDFERDHVSVNHYYINEHFQGEQARVLNKINEVANKGVTYRETGDYGTQPSHYVYITIGKWDKPYEYQN